MARRLSEADSVILDGTREVADYKQCVHCGGHFPVQPGSGKIRGYCMNCGGYICGPSCKDCVPMEKRLELIEAGKAFENAGKLIIP